MDKKVDQGYEVGSRLGYILAGVLVPKASAVSIC